MTKVYILLRQPSYVLKVDGRGYERGCAHINRFNPQVVVTTTDRANAVVLSSPLLCVCLSCSFN